MRINKNCFILIILFLITDDFWVWAETNGQMFLDVKFQEGITYYQNGEYQKSIDFFYDKLDGENDSVIRKILANSYAGLATQLYKTKNADDAIKMFTKAREFNPLEKNFPKNMGIIYYNQGDYKSASEMFETVVSLDDSDNSAHEYLGRSYYYNNLTLKALKELEIVLERDPDNLSLREFKNKVEEENKIEGFFQKTKQEIFLIQYDYQTEFRLSSLVLEGLTEAYWHIVQDFSFYGRKDWTIPVIIYTQKQFDEAISHPDWAGAMYDGKIRIPVGGIDKQKDRELENFIYHEVTHAILFYYCKGKAIPLWLNEGLAQIEEKYPKNIREIKNMLRKRELISLKKLDKSFSDFSKHKMIDLCYAESYLAVSFILEKYSRQAVLNILSKLAEDKSIEEVINSTLFVDLNQFEKRLQNYIESNY